MKPPCPTCGYIHASDDVTTLGRFDPSGAPIAYRAASVTSPTRATRAEAEADACARRVELRGGA